LIFDVSIGSYADRRQRRKKAEREIRTTTEKEREEERSVTHAHRLATEKDRGRENRPEYVVFRPDLSLYAARERYREWVSAGYGWKPTHTSVGLTDPALHLWHSLPLSRSRRSVEISSPV
jgi:hypothetical protein